MLAGRASGSDLPFAPGLMGRAIAGLATLHLGDEARRAIERGNAQALLPRLAASV